MKTKYTPAPWTVLPSEDGKYYIRIRGVKLGCRYKIANVLSSSLIGVLEDEDAVTRANARLIAAAPELLEALEELCDAMHDMGFNFDPSLKKAESVVAKVVGEE